MPFACAARRKSLLGVAAGRRTLHCHGRKAYARHDVMVHHGELDAACSQCSPLTMQPVLLRESRVLVRCAAESNADALGRRHARPALAMPALHVDRRWRTGEQRAGHTRACERAWKAMEARIAQRARIGLCAAPRSVACIPLGLLGEHLVMHVAARAHDMQCRRRARTTSAGHRERQGCARVRPYRCFAMRR